MAKQLVIGIFPSLESAESAIKNLQEGASDYSDMHVGSIGILVLDENGKLKEIKRGQRMGGRGATIGLAVAALTPVGLIAGLAGGAALGHFRQQGPKFSADDQADLASKLDGGKAAVGVLVQAAQADLMADVMNGLGGTVQAHEVEISDEEVVAAEAALSEHADS